MNGYSYANNNRISEMDPTGLESCGSYGYCGGGGWTNGKRIEDMPKEDDDDWGDDEPTVTVTVDDYASGSAKGCGSAALDLPWAKWAKGLKIVSKGSEAAKAALKKADDVPERGESLRSGRPTSTKSKA